jgi:hypothetical protein
MAKIEVKPAKPCVVCGNNDNAVHKVQVWDGMVCSKRTKNPCYSQWVTRMFFGER